MERLDTCNEYELFLYEYENDTCSELFLYDFWYSGTTPKMSILYWS
jgi:hypothetical protein